MGGSNHHFHPVKLDPSVQVWSKMREDVYKTYRWTPRNTRTFLFLGVVFPAAVYMLAREDDNKWDLRAKDVGDSWTKTKQ